MEREERQRIKECWYASKGPPSGFPHPVHDGVGFLRAEPFHKGSESLHVHEHHRDLLVIPFNLALLG